MTPYSLVVITDLDGTLLDQETYAYEPALPAIRRLRTLKIPLVLCSSKTRREMVLLWKELHCGDPFIAENGGGVYFPAAYFPFAIPGTDRRGAFEVRAFGSEVSLLRDALTETADQCGIRVRSLSLAEPEFFARLTGLNLEQAALAQRREYDEPFLVTRGDPERLIAALEAKGFTVSRGDRFFHLTANHDKGRAVRFLLDLYRKVNPRVKSMGLGNSGNDLPLLREVDHPVLVRNPDGGWDVTVRESLPGVCCTQGMGPEGWGEAVEAALAEL